MDFNTYPSIENLYRVPEILEQGDVYAHEKLHGTNARIHVSSKGITPGSKTRTLSGEDDKHFGFTAWAHTQEDWLKRWLTPFQAEKAIIYGEWVGRGIQGGVNYLPGDEKRFVVFDIELLDDGYPMVDANTRKRVFINTEALQAYSPYPVAPCLYTGVPDLEVLNKLANAPSCFAKWNGQESISEGLVIRPVAHIEDRFGNPWRAKLKTETFSEVTNHKQVKVLSEDELAVRKILKTMADTYVNPERIRHCLEQAREQGLEVTYTMSDMRFLIDFVVSDIRKEAPDAMLLVEGIAGIRSIKNAVASTIRINYEKVLLQAA